MKKIIYINFIVIILLVIIGNGCNPNKNNEKHNKKPASSTIEGLTGYTAVKSGKKTANEVKKISAKHQKDLDEITNKE